MPAKCTKDEKERRILKVQGWIIDGAQDNLILRQIKTEWNLGLRQAKNYLREAYDNWKPIAELGIEEKRAAKIAELKQDLRSLKPEYVGTPQGLNAKTQLNKLIIRLEGIEPPRHLKLDIDTTPVIQVVDVAKNKG